MPSFTPQVSGDHYKKDRYLTLERFISFYYQLNETTRLPIKSLLEIGVGTGIVSAGLRNSGIEVTTCDFDASIKPDLVADVRQLPCADSSFDGIMACQVLEHIPWADVPGALKELARVSKKYVIISLPRRHTGFEWIIKFPGIQTLLKRHYVDLSLLIPVRFPGFAKSGQHYWEIDQWQYSLAQVKQMMSVDFMITRVVSPPLNKYHVFFILEKKG